MEIYKLGASKITLGGTDYQADENGIIDVPDDKMNSSVWTQGFVSAKGRLAELAKSAELKAEPVSVPTPVIPVAPTVEEVAEPAPKPASSKNAVAKQSSI